MYNTGFNINGAATATSSLAAAVWMDSITPIMFGMLMAIALIGLLFMWRSRVVRKRVNAEIS